MADKKNKFKFHIHPKYTFDSDIDFNSWELNVNLPEIKKDDIILQVLPNHFRIIATRDEQALYHLERDFPYEVNVEDIHTSYEDGVLFIRGHTKDAFEEGRIVPIE